MHDAYIGRRSENNINASCVTISGGRTEQLDIIMHVFCRITGFTSDFLGFIVVEHIRFFHGALQLHPFTSYSRIFCYATVRSSLFSERIVDIWNNLLPGSACFSSVTSYFRTVKVADLSN